jgi:3-phosphoshikimate 1-carboxyvinyltransferase
MQPIEIAFPNRHLKGIIQISGSKSISNRALIIRALCGEKFEIVNLSDSNDTATMLHLLTDGTGVLDVGDAGTVMRFMTAYLAKIKGEFILTGSTRMKERPIGPLVNALRQLGADISYLDKEGYPPIEIRNLSGNINQDIYVNASVSSQFVSSLMMIGPTLPSGLEIHLEGNKVSEPYIRMTAAMMKYFGIEVFFNDNSISIPAKNYAPRPLVIEPDWSSLSYLYGLAALSESAEIMAQGFLSTSWQGDAVVSRIFELLGVETKFNADGILIKKSPQNQPAKFFEYDFNSCPDLFQTVSVVCAGLGIPCIFTGLETLRLKETDRIYALSQELAKWNVFLTQVPEKFSKKSKSAYYMQEGKISKTPTTGTVVTYGDHRMALSMSMLSMIVPVSIENPRVINKSFSNYWDILQSFGAIIH